MRREKQVCRSLEIRDNTEIRVIITVDSRSFSFIPREYNEFADIRGILDIS